MVWVLVFSSAPVVEPGGISQMGHATYRVVRACPVTSVWMFGKEKFSYSDLSSRCIRGGGLPGPLKIRCIEDILPLSVFCLVSCRAGSTVPASYDKVWR